MREGNYLRIGLLKMREKFAILRLFCREILILNG